MGAAAVPQFSQLQQLHPLPVQSVAGQRPHGARDALTNAQSVLAIIIVVGLVIALVRRSQALAPSQRRELRLVIWTGALALIVLTAALTATVRRRQRTAVTHLLAGLLPLAAVPYAFLSG